MRHGVAALGLLSWDRFLITDTYPGPGEYTVVLQRFEQAGGTTGNTCAALARLGIAVTIASVVGNDDEGRALVDSLAGAGSDVDAVIFSETEPSDSSVIVVSGGSESRDRTIFWIKGARPVMGDLLPVDELLAHQWILLDVDDPRLRHFFLELPAHRSPRTRLFGTMTYLVEMPIDEGWKHVLRHDAVVGNIRELLTLTGTETLDAAIAKARTDLVASACRVLYVSRGRQGALAIRADGVTEHPAWDVEVVDTTGAGDAFAAGCLWGLLDRRDDLEVLRRGNALGGLACRQLGARAGLPSLDDVERLLRSGTTLV